MAKKVTLKKLSTNAKKTIVLCCMVAILVTTGVVNFVFNDKLNSKGDGGGDTQVGKPTAVETFFNSCKSSKDTQRAEELSILESIMVSETATAEMKETANAKKLDILKKMESELLIENTLKAKGFSDIVVNMTDNSINFIIEPAEPTQEQLSQIYTVVVTQTDYKSSQIFVFPIEV